MAKPTGESKVLARIDAQIMEALNEVQRAQGVVDAFKMLREKLGVSEEGAAPKPKRTRKARKPKATKTDAVSTTEPEDPGF